MDSLIASSWRSEIFQWSLDEVVLRNVKEFLWVDNLRVTLDIDFMDLVLISVASKFRFILWFILLFLIVFILLAFILFIIFLFLSITVVTNLLFILLFLLFLFHRLLPWFLGFHTLLLRFQKWLFFLYLLLLLL